MFAQILAVAVALPFVSALSLDALTNAVTGGVVTLNWQTESSDPSYFSVLLANPIFHDTFAIANNVGSALTTLTLELPQVPVGTSYQLQGINVSDVNDVYATSPSFSIGPAPSSNTTTTTTTTTTTPGATTPSSSSIASGTVTPVGTATTPAPAGATTTASPRRRLPAPMAFPTSSTSLQLPLPLLYSLPLLVLLCFSKQDLRPRRGSISCPFPAVWGF
ncbi:hypothetical protein BKA82DRAFT_3137601 [Pisolithus tinctorius]|nr:hypothetical protein BKA82DRAFT_3137601 [Pisolithus tinctorius]